jgi:K+-transporting ATPase ATPase C chain
MNNNSVVNTGRLLGAALRALLVMTVLTGVLYPLAVTGVAQALFRTEANGSEVTADGRVVGSALIGQQGYGLDYFQPRPAGGLGENTVNTQYRLTVSGATNRSADSPELVRWIEEAKAEVAEVNSTAGHRVSPSDVPPDAVTSPAYAGLQVHRVADRNDLSLARVRRLVADHVEGRALGFIGEPRVNVLALNLALEEVIDGR